MNIESVEPRKRIFQVSDVLDESIMDLIKNMDWLNMRVIPFKGPNGETFPRKTLNSGNVNLIKISKAMKEKLPEINSKLGTSLKSVDIAFWLDSPGFNMDVHTDTGIEQVGMTATLQLYLISPDESYGTEFFKSKRANISESIYKFKSIPNTGYIMLNHKNEDGSLPMLWHGMLNPVPEGSYRVSAYWYFN